MNIVKTPTLRQALKTQCQKKPMLLVPTEAPPEPSELQTTTGHRHLASCHWQSRDQKTGQTESPFFGLNPLSLVDLHPLGEAEKYKYHKLNETSGNNMQFMLLHSVSNYLKIKSNKCPLLNHKTYVSIFTLTYVSLVKVL